MKKIETEITIEASAEKVWQVLTDFEEYPKWNPFVRSISGSKDAGGKLKVSLKPPDGKDMTFHPKVKKSEPGKEFRWKGKLGLPGIFDGEHYFMLEEISSKRTRFIHGEKFSGLLIPFMGSMLEKTKDGFVLMNKTLKKECEKQSKPIKTGNTSTTKPVAHEHESGKIAGREPGAKASVAKGSDVIKDVPRKPELKKSVANESESKKSVTPEPESNKPLSKEPGSKKNQARKPGAKTTGSKKSATSKTSAKKTGTKKPVVKKSESNKPVAKKVIKKPGNK